ncbi:hypothetical protein Tco_0275955 [Tanacetum coccineum]
MAVLMLCYFIRIMDPTSSLGRIRLGENVYGSSSEKVKGHGDWNAPEYTDTAGSKEKKVTKALSFYKMETDEVNEWYNAPCFENGLEAYDGEINLAFNENLISNEYVVKLCLDYGVKKGNKIWNFGWRRTSAVCPDNGEKVDTNTEESMENHNLFDPDIRTIFIQLGGIGLKKRATKEE